MAFPALDVFRNGLCFRGPSKQFCAREASGDLFAQNSLRNGFCFETLTEPFCARKCFGRRFALWSLPAAVLRQTVFGALIGAKPAWERELRQ